MREVQATKRPGPSPGKPRVESKPRGEGTKVRQDLEADRWDLPEGGLKPERRKKKRSQAAAQRRRRGRVASLLREAWGQEASRKVSCGSGTSSCLLGPSAGMWRVAPKSNLDSDLSAPEGA